MQQPRGGAGLGGLPDSHASPSDLPPPLQGLRGVDLRRRDTGGARPRAGRGGGPGRGGWAAGPGRPAGAARRRCGAPHCRRGGPACHGERGGGCAGPPARAPPRPRPPPPPPACPSRRRGSFVPAPRPPLRALGPAPRRPLLASRASVGGASGRPGALYVKVGLALRQLLGSRRRGARSVRPSVLAVSCPAALQRSPEAGASERPRGPAAAAAAARPNPQGEGSACGPSRARERPRVRP